MEDEQQKSKNNFPKHLKAADYIAEINAYWKGAPELFRFKIKFIHDVFSSDKFQGTKLLEIGSGATVHSIASASKYFPSIVMSDYVEDNVEELRKWLKDQSSIKQMLDVQAELEGYGNDLTTGRKLIESRIRKNVKRVTRCDVLKDGILLEKDINSETSPPYDVVVSCLTLEICPVDVKGYGDILKRINTLIEPGGGLLLTGFFQSSIWRAGGHTFYHLNMDQPDLLDSLTNAGFGDIEIKTMAKDAGTHTEPPHLMQHVDVVSALRLLVQQNTLFVYMLVHRNKMESEQLKIKDHFAKHLKAVDYISQIGEYWEDGPELFQFMIRFIHDAFSSGKFEGSKLLEIGSGALVHSIASASRFFPNIVMSDYVENNVEELRKWLKGQSSIKQFLDVQAELEGYGNDLEAGRNIIESRIRKNVKRVTRCDVTEDGILLEKDTNPETSPPYDVVVSCLCLEVCPVDVKGYGNIMKRINALIKPGGGLLLAGMFEVSYWEAGGHTFHHIVTKQPDLMDALKNAGFGNIEIKSMGKNDSIQNFPYHELFCLVAKKLKDVNSKCA